MLTLSLIHILKLLNYGFDNYALAEAVTAGQVLDRIYLPKGKVEAVDVTAQETIVLPTAKEGAAGYNIECNMKEGVKAPVSQGDVIGTVTITAPGGTIAETPMLAAESVAKESFWQTIGPVSYTHLPIILRWRRPYSQASPIMLPKRQHLSPAVQRLGTVKTWFSAVQP